jgi:diguanylate cyclase (GGDEF)-like protein
MSPSNNTQSSLRIEALQARYRKQLAIYKGQIEQLSQATPFSFDETVTLTSVAHRLAGSGKAYGFAELSRTAKELEQACDTAQSRLTDGELSAIATPLQALLACLERDSDPSPLGIEFSDHPADQASDKHTPLSTSLLLVDDDPELSAQLSAQLVGKGYRVHCLEDISQLSDAIARFDPLAVVVDMDFYGKRFAGAEQVAIWREDNGALLPVIFISAFDSFEVRLAAVRAGGNHFLSKPLDEKRLVSLLRSELNLTPEQPYRVLLVDDDADLLSLYASVLREAGYRVFTAISARGALILLEQARPELVLIDVFMPDCGGIELGRLIRQHEHFAHIPLLFVSAAADTDVQLACARLASDEFINKPIEPWRLLMVVKSRVSRSRRLQTDGLLMLGPEAHWFQDSLTALPTLKSFRQSVEQGLKQRRPGYWLAVLKIDIRDFHTVNNLYGHRRGDQVLQRLAWGLSQCLNAGDLLCREGGDEFLVLTVGHDAIESVDRQASLLMKSIEQLGPLVEQGAIALSADAGIALAPQDADTADALLHCADTALFLAKKSPSSDVRYFTPSMQREAQARFSLTQEINQALQTGQFVAAYQPIFSVGNDNVVGFEALARWQHPVRGVLGPDAFIPLMEEQGLVKQLTEQMLAQALPQLARWQALQPDLFMSLNLSAWDIQKPDFLKQLKSLLAAYKLAPANVVLEITETALLADWQQAVNTIESLRALGVELALDDFGTGYSSLSYLNRFHAAKLKIDRSFIHSWSQSGDAQLVKTIVQLGRTMGMQVVAEGVERPEELEFLRGLQCDYYQGFLSAKPMFAAEVDRDKWL